jgi:hypothetical protein
MPFIKGYKPTKEHLENLSKSHLKQVPWNKGTKMSDDFKEKCKIRQLGKFFRSESGKKSFTEKTSGSNNHRWIEDRTQVDLNKRRNWAPKCVDWREKVFKRDNWTCRLLSENCKGQLEAHHILRWSEYPELRFIINNGITLCHAHHPRKKSEEKRLSPYFKELVSVSNVLKL